MSCFWGKKRIIVGGLPRSGSTLVRFMLDRSDTILSGPETNFFRFPLWQRQDRGRIARCSVNLAEKLGVGTDCVESAIRQSHSTVEAFDRIMENYAAVVGSSKLTWAEKSPLNCHAYHQIAVEDPDAYFVSTIRHGLDVVTSVIANHDRRADYWCSVQRYIDAMRAVYSFEHPRHFILKYEELVNDPATVTRKLFDFLGERYSDDIVQDFCRPSATRDLGKVNQPKLIQGISAQWVGRWQLPEHSQRVNEFRECSDAMHWLRASGYNDQPVLKGVA